MNRLIIDTNVFWNPDAMQVLMGQPLEVVVPSIVVAERVRQLQIRGHDVDLFLKRIRPPQWLVEPLGLDEALRYTSQIDDPTWKTHARDALIAGHVRPGDVLWTSNVKDFVAIGVPRTQIQRV